MAAYAVGSTPVPAKIARYELAALGSTNVVYAASVAGVAMSIPAKWA
jgi:hypothetical protein